MKEMPIYCSTITKSVRSLNHPKDPTLDYHPGAQSSSLPTDQNQVQVLAN